MFTSDMLERHVLFCGPNIELLVVSVNNVNDPRQKVHIGLWYWPTDNSVVLDNSHSTLEDLDTSAFSSFILVGDSNINFYKYYRPLFVNFFTFLIVLY